MAYVCHRGIQRSATAIQEACGIVLWFCDGRILELDNFRSLQGYGWKNFRRHKLWRGQDKGHGELTKQFVERVSQGGSPMIQFQQLVDVTEASFEAAMFGA